jgi:hypothetical protein
VEMANMGRHDDSSRETKKYKLCTWEKGKKRGGTRIFGILLIPSQTFCDVRDFKTSTYLEKFLLYSFSWIQNTLKTDCRKPILVHAANIRVSMIHETNLRVP